MKNKQRAFTIIELLITVTILAVLVATAVPSFRTIIANNRSSTLATEMVTALNTARSEAIKRGGRVSICSSSDAATCAGAAWQDGWIVFVDGAAADDSAVPVVGTVIKVWGANAAGSAVSASKNGTAVDFVRFNALGLLARSASDNNTVVIDVHQDGCQGDAARQLIVTVGGRVNQRKTACP